MNILLLYNSTQTYTNTVFEHVSSFAKYSAHKWFFLHHDERSEFCIDLSRFDAVGIHYSIRLPFDQVSDGAAEELGRYRGLKFLFIQDEYDNTRRAWHWIKRIGINLVFTVVPEPGIATVYPEAEFPGVRFVTNLTGYVPDTFPTNEELLPPSRREIVVGYRGRPLPMKYGKLGFEKVEIGKMVKRYCREHGIKSDIEWTEETRIYGSGWYDFITSCRSMLGSESGSNVFDWDGSLPSEIQKFRETHREASDLEVYDALVRDKEIDGLMNQISPRAFEAIRLRTVLVLYEGLYSGVLKAGQHFLSLKKDGSNIGSVMASLADPELVDEISERAYNDIILSGEFSYTRFVEFVEGELEERRKALLLTDDPRPAPVDVTSSPIVPAHLTTRPIRFEPPSYNGCEVTMRWIRIYLARFGRWRRVRTVLVFLWTLSPRSLYLLVRRITKR